MKYTLTDSTRLGRPHTLVDDDCTKITEHMYENPGMSVRCVAQELSHKCEMVCTTLKKEGYFPCRISVLHKLKPEDPRYNYCNQFFEKFGRCIERMMTTFFSGKAWFHLLGYVISQNYNIWSPNNLQIFEETLLHPIKVGIWCAISKYRVAGSIFILMKLWTAMSI